MKMKCKRKINIDLAIVASQISGGAIHDIPHVNTMEDCRSDMLTKNFM